MLSGLEYAHGVIKQICKAQLDFIDAYKKQFGIPEVTATFNNPDESLYEKVQSFLSEDKLEALYNKGKKEFQGVLDGFDESVKEFLIAE
jgi:polyribonucleotide nucleotidyltransferase